MRPQNQQNLFLAFFSILFFSTTMPYLYGEPGIDPSWWVSLVMAVNEGYVFGKDFIFNYGPLGYLNTLALPESVSPWFSFLFQLFVLFNFLFIIRLAMQQAGDKWKWVALFAVVVLLPWGFIADISFTLFYFLLFWLMYARITRVTAALLLCMIFVVLIFFIKVNLSMIALGLLLVSLAYFRIVSVFSTLTVVVVIVALTGLIFGLSILLHVDLYHYLQASLKIIDAYQDAMAAMLLKPAELYILLAFESLIVIFVFVFVIRNSGSFKDNLYLYLLISLSWFLMFKQAHTAVGHYNIFGFFLFMPPLALLIYLFALKTDQRQRAVLFVTVLAVQLLATQFVRFSMAGYNVKEYYRFMLPAALSAEATRPSAVFKAIKYKNPVNYFSALFNYDYENNFKNEHFNEQRKLPQEVLNRIGSKSVDIMPWEVSYIFFNRLKYNSRPVIQSYQANSDWLAFKNEEKYFSAGAPEIVLASVSDFREQNPIWVDKGAYLALFKKYAIKDTVTIQSDTLFVFERLDRQSDSLAVKELSKKTKTGNLNEELYIPTRAKLIYLKADVQYSILGKLARLFFQPPYLKCEVNYADGQHKTYRIPPSILRGGVLANRKVTTNKEFAEFNIYKGTINTEIVSMRFFSNQSWGFEREFKVSLEEIK
ncbi:hypothetical protein GVN16_04740 [Emticicia sp. CRIBPO]|uniref:hypothetical protein n=1 Tax=Emticicia sp. CRIBPO TaxID=2683258 RepID=UPI0014122631|nr:hypothetical protein [Emticicia sp. CRIBPO]NBA85053.1 hypothetical protein [Emticicia sp. CRIBPO]